MTNKNPIYLFSPQSNVWKNVSRRLQSAHKLALFLDYDGTLTPIRYTPSAAILTKEAEHVLQQIAKLRNVSLTIVTGRSMEDIRRLVPIENIGIAANHGFHILRNGYEWIHPDAVRLIQTFSRLHAILRNKLEIFPKALAENKQFTLSVHYRNISENKVSSLKSLVMKIVRSFDSTLKITRGKKVLEVRPKIVWGKGNAVLEILRTSKYSHRPLPIFIGDDTTDEDVFQVLRSKGITIRVGKSLTTKAKYFVEDVNDVLLLLKLILELRNSSHPHNRP